MDIRMMRGIRHARSRKKKVKTGKRRNACVLLVAAGMFRKSAVLENAKRDAVIRRIRELKISIRRFSRITGISRAVIERVLKA